MEREVGDEPREQCPGGQEKKKKMFQERQNHQLHETLLSKMGPEK